MNLSLRSAAACALVLFITLGPKLPLEAASAGRAVELRLQDVLLVPLALGLLVTNNRRILSSTPAPKAIIGLASILILTTLIALWRNEYADLRILGYAGRAVENLALYGVVVAILARNSMGIRQCWWLLWGCLGANLAWILFQQYIIGTPRLAYTFSGNARDAFSYGPMLLGESSPFAAGMLLALIVAGAIAYLVPWPLHAHRGTKLLALGAICAAMLGLALVGSRAGLLAAGTSLLLAPLLHLRKRAKVTWLATLVLLVLLGGLLFTWEALPNRIDYSSIAYSTDFRITEIWLPLVDEVMDRPISGHGPGALGALDDTPQVEAHNYPLRLAVEHGLFAPLGFFAVLAGLSAVALANRNGATYRGHVCRCWLLYAAGSVMASMVQDAFFPVVHGHLFWLLSGVMVAACLSRDASLPLAGGRPQTTEIGSLGAATQ